MQCCALQVGLLLHCCKWSHRNIYMRARGAGSVYVFLRNKGKGGLHQNFDGQTKLCGGQNYLRQMTVSHRQEKRGGICFNRFYILRWWKHEWRKRWMYIWHIYIYSFVYWFVHSSTCNLVNVFSYSLTYSYLSLLVGVFIPKGGWSNTVRGGMAFCQCASARWQDLSILTL